MNKKILIFKNDRGGDLLNSIKCISTLMKKNNLVTIYLSQLNYSFSFLFKNAIIKKINFDLNIINKIQIFFHLFKNKYDEVYILTPKNYYYFLAIFFKRVKFYAITINGTKRNRPNNYIRKFLHKFITIDKKHINVKSSSELQLELIDDNDNIDHNFQNINEPKLNSFIKKNLPKDFLFIQYKDNFYNKINLTNKNFVLLLNEINKKFKYIVFSSDIEENASNNFFYENYTVIDCKKKIINFKENNANIIYLHKINAEDLFAIINEAKNIISPHGLVTHMCQFYKRKSINLFNYEINNMENFYEQKIAFYEWYKNMNIMFLFLDNNIDRSIKKIIKNL